MGFRKTTSKAAKVNRQVVAWNRVVPIGTMCIVHKYLGNETFAAGTRSAAFIASSGEAVIFLEGRSAFYRLDRVKPHPMTGIGRIE